MHRPLLQRHEARNTCFDNRQEDMAVARHASHLPEIGTHDCDDSGGCDVTARVSFEAELVIPDDEREQATLIVAKPGRDSRESSV